MKKLIFFLVTMSTVTMSFASTTNCTKRAYEAARAVDAISNNTPRNLYELVEAKIIRTGKSGTTDTIEVHLLIGEDQPVIWHVNLHNSGSCVIKQVKHIAG